MPLLAWFFIFDLSRKETLPVAITASIALEILRTYEPTRWIPLARWKHFGERKNLGR
jgi:hypothetical protein